VSGVNVEQKYEYEMQKLDKYSDEKFSVVSEGETVSSVVKVKFSGDNIGVEMPIFIADDEYIELAKSIGEGDNPSMTRRCVAELHFDIYKWLSSNGRFGFDIYQEMSAEDIRDLLFKIGEIITHKCVEVRNRDRASKQ